jgi:hypothetical protein
VVGAARLQVLGVDGRGAGVRRGLQDQRVPVGDGLLGGERRGALRERGADRDHGEGGEVFDAQVVDADADLYEYDVLVADDAWGFEADVVKAWVDSGGAYVANGPYGIVEGLLDVKPMGGYDWSFYWANNCLGLTEYSDTSLVSPGMGESGYTFGFPITWFEELGGGVEADAAYADPYFLAGFWQSGDPTGLTIADAAGKPVVVSGKYGNGRATFIGPMAAFRAHTQGTYRLLANAIWTQNYGPKK